MVSGKLFLARESPGRMSPRHTPTHRHAPAHRVSNPPRASEPSRRSKPPIHPPKLKQKKSQLHTTIQLALPEWCLGRERFYIPIISVSQIFQAKTQAFCGIFVEIQLRIRVELSKTKTGVIHPVPFTPTTEYWHLVI